MVPFSELLFEHKIRYNQLAWIFSSYSLQNQCYEQTNILIQGNTTSVLYTKLNKVITLTIRCDKFQVNERTLSYICNCKVNNFSSARIFRVEKFML